MQKKVYLAALALLAAPAAANAQATGQIAASATIAQVVQFDNANASAISFGEITPDVGADRRRRATSR